MNSAFVIAAPHSGAGKTTVTLALLAALTRRGLAVQSFKNGPDYIDPAHHAAITGRPAPNLDTWMLPEAANRRIFARAAAGADVAVAEGAMGLFDGVDGARPDGSTAHLARTLGLPVVLVVDARSMARSVAALVSGFCRFDPALRVAGVIWNRVGSPAHRRILDEAVNAAGLPPVLGAFGRDASLSLGERHLGLVTPQDSSLPPDWLDRLARAAETAVDIDALLAATSAPPFPAPPRADRAAASRRIAVARDRAYTFYYEENFDILTQAGAELLFFAPTEGEGLPPGIDAAYLGGGYPEVHAARIAKNEAFLGGLRELAAAGGRIYAECGGFMTLCRELVAGDGRRHRMAGVFPAVTRMENRLHRLGYREVETLAPLAFPGLSARGHEFHYSRLEEMPDAVPRAYRVKNARGEPLDPEGFLLGNVLGGYIHLHFASNPEFAERFFGL